jgi:5'-deoxynucleotidase YfbR-like HD superfamily hydrolase
MGVIPFNYGERIPRSDHNFMRTFTGRKFWPLDPSASEICIEDVAHHLALECRFNGATYCHYSVAEHAIRVSRLAEQMVLTDPRRTPAILQTAREVALWALHHDDSEAYLKDLIRPVKHGNGLGAYYRAVERELMGEVIAAFDLLPHEPMLVKEADTILGHTEGRDLVACYEVPAHAQTLPERIHPLDPHAAEAEFLRRHHALIMARQVARAAE